ncbi:MAG: NPCBM/NEW2 domain-containing protein [Oscillospiraceae bacterium]|nr:NPCBM/NEW2 domain-containing protein [Oscillospiraceae bacterium]
MKKGLKGFVAGAVVGALTTGTIGALAGYSNYIEAYYNNIKIVVDGTEIHPNSEPFISNGTTYLPVRDVANAFGQSVYWDGPNYTVYLGEMSGKLEYASATLKDVDNIGDKFYEVGSDKLTDNYGNTYSYALYSITSTFQTLLNMKYSKFKCTIYVPKGCDSNKTAKILIKTDGKTVYTSPDITKTSRPIDVEVDVTGCNDFQIEVTDGFYLGYIADAGFYQ